MEENEVVDVKEVIPTSVDEVSQLWTQVQDVVAAPVRLLQRLLHLPRLEVIPTEPVDRLAVGVDLDRALEQRQRAGRAAAPHPL